MHAQKMQVQVKTVSVGARDPSGKGNGDSDEVPAKLVLSPSMAAIQVGRQCL
jgi:hypothetical protein